MTAAQEKVRLRGMYIQRRRSLGQDDLDAARAGVRNAVLAEVAKRGWTRVAAYAPLRTEPGSLELLQELRARGVQVLVPITLPDHLDWAEWPGSVPLGPQAVASVDALFVPALAVDRSATRLGRGRGYYDRTLGGIEIPVVALLHRGELVDDVLPAEPWDVPMSAVVTPDGWFDL